MINECMPKVTVVTITYNNLSGLVDTVRSIAKQSYDNIEFIVIDGYSTDGSLDFINKSANIIDMVVSEPDSGIYDAMNKGINLSSGDWIYFLNAGDTLEDCNVLSALLDEINSLTDDVNMVYGSHKADGVEYKQVCSLPFLVSHMINHQSMIYHRSLFEHGYDLRYRFCADYAHLLSVWPQLKPKALDICIANFDTTGVSAQASNKARMWQERLQAVWRSDLKFTQKILLSRRGVMALPYHYLKNWLVRLNK